MTSLQAHRPRDVDWKRAAALLYGDWGTSKAYVIGIAFAAMGFASMPIILAMCALTALVGINYAVVCRFFPDGGGVYSAARMQARMLGVVGALLLVGDMTVTAALSGWAALSYLGVPQQWVGVSTIAAILALGAVNFYGPRHSGSLAVGLAIPTVAVVVILVALGMPHFSVRNLEPHVGSFGQTWTAFVGVILALSGVEAVANLTGVMTLDPGSTPGEPKVGRTSFKAILPVLLEVTLGTALLGWAMLSLPRDLAPQMIAHKEDMLRFLAEQYGALNFGGAFSEVFGVIAGVVFALLLLSAVNTAIVALVGLLFMMSRDGEMPQAFLRLNPFGVPWIPLAISVGLPVAIVLVTNNFDALTGLYAIGVVGAITVNLGCCTLNKKLPARWHERALFGVTFLVLLAVEITLAKTKPDALFFVTCVLGVGLALCAWSHKITGLKTVTVAREVAEIVTPEAVAALRPQPVEGARILVATRGFSPLLRFALEEAQLRKATLYILHIKEIAVYFTATLTTTKPARWQDDPEAQPVMSAMLKEGQELGIPVIPLYAVTDTPPATILDICATLGVDYLLLGEPRGGPLAHLLRGDTVAQIAEHLPEDIHLIVHG
jgi:amino acid transporter/nucleotide-binding universal stress UspA family protein